MNKALENYECDGQLSFAFNGNITPCPYIRECNTYGVGCQGTSYWCKRFDEPQPQPKAMTSAGKFVWIIKYEWMPNRKLCVYNKRGNNLEFYDKEHAEYFLRQHPEAVNGHPYEIVPVKFTEDSEYGRTTNVWEGEQ